MDKIPLSSHQLFAFFFPGLVFVFPSIYCFYFVHVEPGTIDSFFKHYKDNEVLISFIVIVLALLSGLIIDSVRNGIIEVSLDKIIKNKKKKINWDFFFEGKEEGVKPFYERYYNFYVFDLNASIAIILSWIVLFATLPFCDFKWLSYSESIAAAILVFEATSLRKEIIKITHKP